MTYGVTWGEGDGAGAGGNLTIIKSATTDVIEDSLGDNFATTVSLTGEIHDVAVGDALRITARGVFSTYGLAGGFEIQVKNGGDVLLTTGSQTVAANLADRGWWIEAVLIQLSPGSNNQGTFHFSNTVRLAESMDMENGANSAVDLTSGSITLAVVWGAADAANSISLRQLVVEKLTNG